VIKKYWIKPTKEVVLRVLADIVLISLSVLAALFIRFIYLVLLEEERAGSSYRDILLSYLRSYSESIWLLVLISLVVFALSGFYTHGRAYHGRYKVLVVAQAISLGFLIYAFFAYFILRDVTTFPRGALIIAWGITLIVLVLARLWAYLWHGVVRKEWYQTPPEQRGRIRNVLVIGGAGYIGSALLPKLLDRGYNVRLLDLLLYGEEPIQNVLSHPNLEVVQADFRQVDRVVEAMRGIDAVIHLGAIVGDPACALDEDLTIEINVMATRMIAEVAKGSDVSRFIFASTCSVYGASDHTLDERSNPNPVSLYARSKLASEVALHKMATDRFSVVILRFGTVYGISGRTRFDLVVNLLAAKAVVDRLITIYGGDQWRPFIHVDDTAAAVLKIIEAPRSVVHNQIFNVGSDQQNYTINKVGELIHDMIPDAELTHQDIDLDPRNYRVDFGKIADAIGFYPLWTVKMGVEQVIQAIQSGRVSDYRDARYSNVKFLKEEGLLDLLRKDHRWAYDLNGGSLHIDELESLHAELNTGED
jgi:nucleoside-diphosphate-sugar epimerase